MSFSLQKLGTFPKLRIISPGQSELIIDRPNQVTGDLGNNNRAVLQLRFQEDFGNLWTEDMLCTFETPITTQIGKALSQRKEQLATTYALTQTQTPPLLFSLARSGPIRPDLTCSLGLEGDLSLAGGGVGRLKHPEARSKPSMPHPCPPSTPPRPHRPAPGARGAEFLRPAPAALLNGTWAGGGRKISLQTPVAPASGCLQGHHQPPPSRPTCRRWWMMWTHDVTSVILPGPPFAEASSLWSPGSRLHYLTEASSTLLVS